MSNSEIDSARRQLKETKDLNESTRIVRQAQDKLDALLKASSGESMVAATPDQAGIPVDESKAELSSVASSLETITGTGPNALGVESLHLPDAQPTRKKKASRRKNK